MRWTASACRSCRRRVFPGVVPCPLCGSTDARRVELPRAGIVETFTTMGAVAVGEVRLLDGTLVLARLDVEHPTVGMTVRRTDDAEAVVFE